ncbi:MAG: AAA family ATPase [Promethearchaeota archaeon]|nr:MAG: AAA family ATPase [Candidatus Lokiarchaeota archaeon]
MIITISGLHGTGKSTIGKLIAEKMGIKYYSTGQAFRDLAQEMKMTLAEFTKYVERNPEIDKKLDNRIIEIAKKGNVIIDSQLSGYLLKDFSDFNILLTCPLETRVKRMIQRDNSDYEEKIKETKMREKSELERFKLLYNIDLSNQQELYQIYDLIINTESLSVEEIFKEIILKLEKVIK